MDSFLQQTARSIIEQIEWKQLSRTTLVLPSHRAGLVLKNELLRLQQEQHAQAVWAPHVQTLTQLQDALSPLYAEDELFTIVRLYRHYLRLNEGETDLMPLDMFYGWGRQMLADFTNVDASMKAEQVPNFFDNTIAAHELEEWKLDDEVRERLESLVKPVATTQKADQSSRSIRNQYEVLWRQLYTLYQDLRAEMLAEQKGYAGMRQRAVIEQWEDEYVQSQIAGRTYIFVGFNYLLPVERELMELLRDAGQAQFYWDYVPDFQTNEKAFSFAKQNSGILGSQNTVHSAQSTDAPKQVTVMACTSREAQAQYVHQWLLENYKEKGQKVGVVICDETMLESVIYTLPAITLPGENEAVPVNITKGFPLRNTHIYARVLAWMSDKKHGEAEDIVSPEFIDTLLADLFPAKNVTPANPDNTQDTKPLNWKDLLILESEYQVRKIANQMRLLLTKGLGEVPFTLKLLRLLMRRTMESVTMPFHGEPVTDIQVMGVLETRLLDFDKLLLLNVEEGVLPQQQADISFIPYYLRKTYHMQTPDERATVYAYNFFRLLSRAGHTTMLYATADSVEGGKGMSRFIMQIMASKEFEVSEAKLHEQSIVVKMDDTRLGTNSMSFTGHSLSPSALNTYIDCPRLFCFRYIQHRKEPETEEGGEFEANTLGSFVHYAMEYLYREYLKCDNSQPAVRVTPAQVRALNTDECRQDALKYAYSKMNEEWLEDHHDSDETLHYVLEDHAHKENIIIDGYVRNILLRDEQDAATGLQIYRLEEKYYFSLPLEEDKSIKMGGKIDRLDIYGPPGEEVVRVIDYKTGSYAQEKLSSLFDVLMESPAKSYVRQTLIYCQAFLESEQEKRPIEPNLFFCRHNLTETKSTININKKELNDYSSIQGMFIESLKAKVQEIVSATEFPPCAENKCKAYCPFLRTCGRSVLSFSE